MAGILHCVGLMEGRLDGSRPSKCTPVKASSYGQRAFFAKTSRVRDVDTSLPAKRRNGPIDSSALPASFEEQVSAAKIHALIDNAFDQASIDTFLNSGSALNIMRQKIDILPILVPY